MTELEYKNIQDTFTWLEAKLPQALKAFSSRLMEMDSSLGMKFMKTQLSAEDIKSKLRFLVEHIQVLETKNETLSMWVKAAEENGFEEYDFQIMGSVYVDTLAHIFGKGFTPEIMNAWVNVYKDTLTEMMN